MPIPSVYAIGTSSFTQGSPAVTGIGTNWIGAAIREGDLFWADGLLVRVLSVESNTGLTLAHPWPGTTRTDHVYEIQYTHDSGRILAKSSAVLDAMDGTALNALGSTTPAADRVPYFNSGNSAALAVLTPRAREFLALLNTAAMLSNLGIAIQSGPHDQTTGRLLRVGAFGLGAGAASSIVNFDNTDIRAGIYSVTASSVGTRPPLNESTDLLFVLKLFNTIGFQLYFTNSAAAPVYYRKSTALNTWTAWKQIVME